ncbi:MAG: zinc-binding dehydrogenase [Myxococcota bacterium]
MRQVWITRVGPPEVLQLREDRDPEPGPGQLRIQVQACGINFADIMARIGVYPDAPPMPCVVGYEVAGIIDKLDDPSSGFKVGDKVVALCRFGGYSDVVCVSPRQVFAIPDNMTFPEAVALPVNGVTAYQTMVVMGALKARERILIHGAAGGVGLAAIDIARIVGAEIYGTASAAKHPFLRDRGVHHCIDYRTQDFESEVMRLTNGEGVHLVIDPIGGESWTKSMAVLAPTGRLACIGFSGAAQSKGRNVMAALTNFVKVPWLQFSPIALMNANKAVIGVNLGHLWKQQDLVAGWMRQIMAWAREGKIRPHVGQTFPLAEAAAAHHYIQDRKNTGKVVLVP